MNIFASTAAAVAASLCLAGSANAATYDISWTGDFGYSLTGQFSFADTLIGTTIEVLDLSSFTIEVFQSLVSQGTWNAVTDPLTGSFNFNFDSATAMFLVGGLSSSTSGQLWNMNGPGGGCASKVGFASGNVGQAVCTPISNLVGVIPVSRSTLTATAVAAVPLPAGLVLLFTALGGLGLVGRKWRAA